MANNFNASVCHLMLLGIVLSLDPWPLTASEVVIPGYTAYMLPDPESAEMSRSKGVTHWDDPKKSVNWYGRFQTLGRLTVKVDVRLPPNTQPRFRVTMAGQSRESTPANRGSDPLVTADFGEFEVQTPGYQRIQLQSLHDEGLAIGEVVALRLAGDAADGAHFNLHERRNAASVHLLYPIANDKHVEAFYCEVTAIEDPPMTFYMACGWHRGYLGMQVNSPQERRIIFSVWDSGNEAVDRTKVADDDRVKLLAKGDGVHAGDFGNEGTGGHSHLKYLWKTGTVQRFLVTAKPVDGSQAIFSGYWFHPEQQRWMLISSWRAPKEQGWLRHLHSFSENFGGSNGHLLRKARFGNQWARTAEGDWIELTQASFSHDPTGNADRLDRWMGVEEGQFFLSHGGFVDGFTKYGEQMKRTPIGKPPGPFDLP